MGNQRQKTCVNGYTSNEAQVMCGTAQGSILGPLIFIIYINDLFKSIKTSGKIYMYADDTLIVCKSNDIEIVTSEIETALGKMFNWCTANKLSINLSKTKHMTIQHTKPDLEPAVHVNNKCINTVKSYEYLGMSLVMNDHIDNMWKKANAKVGILSKIRRFISQKTAVTVYKCMISR